MDSLAEPIVFYDSASRDWPDDADYLAVYADGDFKVPPADYAQLKAAGKRLHSITVTGSSWQPELGDFEPGNPIYDVDGRLREWAEGRIARGLPARPYCDRADLHLAFADLGPLLVKEPLLQWWIPTLDGRVWTPAELATDIAANWGVYIPAAKIWACQNTRMGDAWDSSDLFGSWN